MDMKKILQAVDGISARPVNGADSMARFLRVVREAEINQPTAIQQPAAQTNVSPAIKPYVHAPGPDDPNFDKYGDLMWKYEFLDNERTGKANRIPVNVSVSDETNAEIDRLKYEAEKLAGPNLQAWEKARIGYKTDPEYIKYSQDMAAKLSAELLEDANVASTLQAVTPVKVPPIPQLPAQDGDLGDGSKVTTNADGTRSYSSGMGTFTYDAQGKAITYASPKMSGYGQTLDLTTNQMVHDYQQGPLQLHFKVDTQGRPITSRVKYDLGGAAVAGEQDHVTGIRSTEIAPRVGDGTDTAATLAAAHQIMPTSAIAGARGVDPKKFAAFQKQNPTAVKEDDNIKARAKAAFDELDNPDTELKTSSDAEIWARLAAQKGKGTKLNDMNPLDRDQWLKSTGRYWDTATQTVKPLPVKENSLSKFLSIVRKNDVSILREGAGPHKVALPVQMAMQHYQQVKEVPQPRERLIDKYFVEAEAAITQRKEEKRALYNQYAKTIANRVLMKESVQGVPEGSDPNKLAASVTVDGEFKEFDLTPLIAKNNWVGTPKQIINLADKWLGDFFRKRGSAYSNLKLTYKGMTLNANQVGDVGSPDLEFESIAESPIAMDPAEPNNPTIHNHEKANTMTLKNRIASARAQLQELAELSESNSLLAWEQICKKAKGGMFMGLEQNLEQIRHGIEELAKQRRKGGTASRGIDKHIGEGKTK